MCEKLKKKLRSIMNFDDPIKKYVNLTSKLLTSACKSKVVMFKLD